MRPYYQDEMVTLYHGDCRETNAWLEADVLVTDPPYGIGWKISAKAAHSGGRASYARPGIANDHDTGCRDEALAMWAGRPGIVFGSWSAPFPENRQVLVWRKPSDSGVIGSTTGYRRDAELIFLVGRWPKRAASRSSVLTTDAGMASYLKGHPHAKPLSLMTRLMEWTEGVVADPFTGSGSTLVAAKQLGRKAIGVELEERYCEIAAKRLAQGVLDFGGAA